MYVCVMCKFMLRIWLCNVIDGWFNQIAHVCYDKLCVVALRVKMCSAVVLLLSSLVIGSGV